MLHITQLFMNRLSKTESVVFVFCDVCFCFQRIILKKRRRYGLDLNIILKLHALNS